jgi:hypothetical protein
MASGCSAADDGDMPSNDPGAPQGRESPAAKAPAPKLDPASVTIVDDEDALHLIAQVGLEGRVVKFFEPEEGTLLEIEKAFEGVKADPNEEGLSGSALYTYLTKSEAPAALLDAERRVNDMATRNGIDVLKDRQDLTGISENIGSDIRQTPGSEQPGLRPATSWDEGVMFPVTGSENYFLDKYCRQTDRFWSCGNTIGTGCFSNSHFEAGGLGLMQAGIHAVDDSHRFYFRYGAIERAEGGINQGELVGWRRTSGVNKTGISDADYGGSGYYRHCVNYHY